MDTLKPIFVISRFSHGRIIGDYSNVMDSPISAKVGADVNAALLDRLKFRPRCVAAGYCERS